MTGVEEGWSAHLPTGMDPAGLELHPARNLTSAWAARWAADPNRPVLHDAERGWVVAKRLQETTARLAGRLHGAGLAAGDRVLVSASTSISLVECHVAALRLGLVVVPMNTAYTEREVAHIVRDAEPAAAVVDDAERGRWIGVASNDGALVLDPTVGLPDAAAPPLDVSDRDDAALIAYTSGTTGVPKGAVLTHGNLLANVEALRLAWRWGSDDRLVLALPLFHVHGLGIGLHGTLHAGASALLQDRFDPDGVFDAIVEHGATLFFGVPTMYARLAASARVGELAALRLCVSGSAPLSAALHRRIGEASGQAVLERYGMTETMMNTSNPYDGDRRPGSVGLPLPGVWLRLAEGRTGEILVRGPNVFAGYWRNPEGTAGSFDADGWFLTGDVGELEDDGYLRIVGRTKELIISGGYNVYPREVEDVLRDHPSVRDVCVAGTPSDEWGEVVTAYVVAADPDPNLRDDLLGFAAERLAPYKRPRQIHFVPEVPRNAMGKVLRHELPHSRGG